MLEGTFRPAFKNQEEENNNTPTGTYFEYTGFVTKETYVVEETPEEIIALANSGGGVGVGLATEATLLEVRDRNLPFNADYLAQSNPDANGRYQTITYKQGGASGTIVKTVSLTFDSFGSILTYTES